MRNFNVFLSVCLLLPVHITFYQFYHITDYTALIHLSNLGDFFGLTDFRSSLLPLWQIERLCLETRAPAAVRAN